MRLWAVGQVERVEASVMGRLTTVPVSRDLRSDAIAYVTNPSLSDFGDDWSGYAGILSRQPVEIGLPLPGIAAAPNLEYLGDGDVVQLHSDGTVQVLYRRSSEHNTILATERCN